MGQWEISFITGEFHIWPKGMSMLDEHYMTEELTQPTGDLEVVDAEEMFSLS